MRQGIALALSVIALVASLSGCDLGYRRALFFTKTNIGIDIDSQPATMELSLARREAVLEPAFENGQTAPVLASFSWSTDGWLGLRGDISSAFSGGDAALILSVLYDDHDVAYEENDPRFNSALTLEHCPVELDSFGNTKKLLIAGVVEPFIFATDTSFGLKVGWSGATAQLPDTIKLGYNRKEFALAPITLDGTPASPASPPFTARMPSFLATIDNRTRLGSTEKSSVTHIQYFATGKAANWLATRHAVREAMFYRLDPEAAEAASGFTKRLQEMSFRDAKWLLRRLGFMHNHLRERADLALGVEKDETAEALLKALNKNAPDVGIKYDVTLVSPDPNDSNNVMIREKDTVSIVTDSDTSKLIPS